MIEDSLALIEAHFAELEAKSMDPATHADAKTAAALMKEYRTLLPTAEKIAQLRALECEAKQTKAMMEEEQDEALCALAATEYRALQSRIEAVRRELQIMLIAKDENDDKSIMVELRAGAGGEEAALFAAVLYRMYTMYATAAGFRTSLLSANETELGGYREVVFSVEGEGAFSKLKFESGVHRVQRVPVTESQGRIQTSTVTVAVLPEVDEVEVVIDPADIIMESCKSSGAGGQHINKTESAVRLTHKPTGIVVECQEERSQFKNRDKAMKLLRARLYDMARREQEDKIATSRRDQVGTGDRSERIRTYNYAQNRVTDHRIGLSLYKLDKMLDGCIDELLDALAAEEIAKKLQSDAT